MVRKQCWQYWVLGALVLGGSPVALAGEWSLGASVLVQSTPYKGVKSKDYVTPLPVINYDGEDFYFHTLTAGYYLWRDNANTLSWDVYYYPQFFHPNQNDDEDMRQLRHHRDTVMSGLTYSHHADWGTLRTSASADILGVSNGMRADGAYLYTFSGEQWELEPGLGVVWNSRKQNRYEYGITRKESHQSGLDYYQPRDSWSPYVELSGLYHVNSRWMLFAQARVERVPAAIHDSPMVNKSFSSELWSGVTYTF